MPGSGSGTVAVTEWVTMYADITGYPTRFATRTATTTQARTPRVPEDTTAGLPSGPPQHDHTEAEQDEAGRHAQPPREVVAAQLAL